MGFLQDRLIDETSEYSLIANMPSDIRFPAQNLNNCGVVSLMYGFSIFGELDLADTVEVADNLSKKYRMKFGINTAMLDQLLLTMPEIGKDYIVEVQDLPTKSFINEEQILKNIENNVIQFLHIPKYAKFLAYPFPNTGAHAALIVGLQGDFVLALDPTYGSIRRYPIEHVANTVAPKCISLRKLKAPREIPINAEFRLREMVTHMYYQRYA